MYGILVLGIGNAAGPCKIAGGVSGRRLLDLYDPRALRAQICPGGRADPIGGQLDDEQRAGAMAEFDDDAMAAELMGNMNETDASRMLSEMDPDDAAELVSELDYDKAEKLLRLMGVQEQRAIRQLLGYRENTAGRIMTSEVATIDEGATVADAVALLRGLDEAIREGTSTPSLNTRTSL